MKEVALTRAPGKSMFVCIFGLVFFYLFVLGSFGDAGFEAVEGGDGCEEYDGNMSLKTDAIKMKDSRWRALVIAIGINICSFHGQVLLLITEFKRLKNVIMS